GLRTAVGGTCAAVDQRLAGAVLALQQSTGDHEVGAGKVASEDFTAEAILFGQALVRIGESAPELRFAQVEDALQEAASSSLGERVGTLSAQRRRRDRVEQRAYALHHAR